MQALQGCTFGKQKRVEDLDELFHKARTAHKCLDFCLRFETTSMVPVVRLFSHSDAMFKAFKVDPVQYSEHAEVIVDGESEEEEETLPAHT